MLNFHFAAHLRPDGRLGLVPALPDGWTPAGAWGVRLYALPVAFNSVGAAEGPTLDLGRRDGGGGGELIYDLPAEVAYGPYSLFGLLDDGGPPVGASDALGLVLRPPGKAYAATLKREAVETGIDTLHDLTGYRLRIRVVEAVGLPRALFLFRRSRDGLGRVGNEFLSVCRPADLTEYPEGAPVGAPGKYRLDLIDVVTHRQAEMEEMWRLIRDDVGTLIETLESNRRLGDAEVVAL
jgi:hypothetical protein